jgi:hypothetical protein
VRPVRILPVQQVSTIIARSLCERDLAVRGSGRNLAPMSLQPVTCFSPWSAQRAASMMRLEGGGEHYLRRVVRQTTTDCPTFVFTTSTPRDCRRTSSRGGQVCSNMRGATMTPTMTPAPVRPYRGHPLDWISCGSFCCYSSITAERLRIPLSRDRSRVPPHDRHR